MTFAYRVLSFGVGGGGCGEGVGWEVYVNVRKDISSAGTFVICTLSIELI